jgi:hypothetical protein
LELSRDGGLNSLCEVFEDKANFEIGFTAVKEKVQAQYDESLVGNKI